MRDSRKGYLFLRGTTFWVRVFLHGKWINRSTEINFRKLQITQDEARNRAEKLLAVVTKQAAAEQDFATREQLATPILGPTTVRRFADYFITQREKENIGDVRTERSWLHHYIIPLIGDLAIKDIRPTDVKALLAQLRNVEMVQFQRELRRPEESNRDSRTRRTLSPKSLRNVYGVFRLLMSYAVAERIIEPNMNPCLGVVPKRSLGPKRDANPNFRREAVFTRDELLTLISDERIAPDSRILYSIQGLAGLRHGEAAALRWSDFHTDTEHLSVLRITKSNGNDQTKTAVDRDVPVHPMLQRIIAEWKLSDWGRLYGRPPLPGDLIIPTGIPVPGKGRRVPAGEMRGDSYSRKRLHKDLEMLGFRKRRDHDLRRTFITLALYDGANDTILKWATHGRDDRQIMDAYRADEWEALCCEILKLDLRKKSPIKKLLALASGEDL